MTKTPVDQRKRAVIYTRISKDRNGESLAVDRQEKACRDLARLMELKVVKPPYTDNDISAFNGKRRDGFEDMLEAIRAGGVDVVLCQHTDRLYRRLSDLVRLADAGPTLLIKTVQGADLDLSNATGKMVANILGSVQEQESAHHSERRKLAYVQKAELGRFFDQGNRTFGYTTKGQPLEPEATMFRTAVADMLEGKSLRAISREWNASGVTTTLGGQVRRKPDGSEYRVAGEWSSTRIRRILLNPRYAGIRTHRGKVVGQGDWTPLIDEETYGRVVAELSDPSRLKMASGRFERKYVGSGVYLCGVCGATMRVSFPGRNQGRKYTCSAHSCVMRSGQPVDDYVENAVLERLGKPEVNLLIAKRGVDVGKLQDRRAGWVTKLENIVELIDDGSLDVPGARKKAATYKNEIAEIDAQLSAAARTSPTAALLANRRELRKRWAKLSPSIRSQIIDEVAVVTIKPTPVRGMRGFNPDYIDVEWKEE